MFAGTEANYKPDSRSKVDLTVESEKGVAAEELRRAPVEAQQQLVARRSSSSSSSSGRGIQKLTIKMILKEKKHDSSGSINPSPLPAGTQRQQVDLPHSTTALDQPGRRDDLPNGATAASTSYRQQLSEEADAQPVRRAISTSFQNRRFGNGPSSSGKARLSSSQVELCKPEIITLLPAAPMPQVPQIHIPIYDRRPATRESTMSRAYSQASSSFARDPNKPKPYRSYERLDIINDDGGRVMREVVEELRGDHITIQIHEKGQSKNKQPILFSSIWNFPIFFPKIKNRFSLFPRFFSSKNPKKNFY
jgi:hypothetical protein